MGGDTLHCCYREQLSYAWYAKFRLPKIYKYAVSGDWDLIPARCQTHPKEVSFVNKYAPNDTALHRVLHTDLCSSAQYDADTFLQLNQLKWEAVQALVQVDRNVVHVADAFGRMPLHLACMDVDRHGFGQTSSDATSKDDIGSLRNGATDRNDFSDPHRSRPEQNGSVAIAIYLAEANPTAVTRTDAVDQRTPLHFLVARNQSIPINLLRCLITMGPTSVQQRDVTGETPLDIVHRRREEIMNYEEVQEMLVSASTALPRMTDEKIVLQPPRAMAV